ncbi:WD40-repeat-containing domain protein [Myxozyma melibiosi]|uniref:WD40-repeat-containing domain protein n=1 Tax=Myxozyma melibiosi TaxID=54550 RepID=A0ABR1FAF0_9ASCO
MASESKEDGGGSPKQTPMPLESLPPLPQMAMAPISTFALEDNSQSQALMPRVTDKVVAYNPTYDELTRPFVGPANPKGDASLKRKNMLTGYAEEQAFNDAAFRVQHRTFKAMGYARDPSLNPANSSGFAGDEVRATENEGRDLLAIKTAKTEVEELKKKRQKKGDSGTLDGDNAYKGPWATYTDPNASSSEESSSEESEESEEEPQEAVTPKASDAPGFKEKTQFHGSSLYDYMGRTYMHVPRDLDFSLDKDPGEQECFIPKRRVHTWAGHKNGVTALRFFPRHGHLLLSSGMDNKVKIWDCYHDRELLRSYSGHSRTVKDICFSNDGTKFLSASYDSFVKLWDTETGQCISRFSTGAIPNCVKFNPDDDKQDQFVIGTSNNKIVQFDVNSGEVVQEYDHHLGPVNSILFVDENRRFMSSSDDKSLRVWEWQINVPIKFIADPMQHSMPTLALHPTGKYLTAQSLDNQILTFAATDRFKANRKKVFKGNNCAGYAIQMDFSPDGQYLMSGDSGGYACFWDWKTTKMKSKFKAHEKALTCIAAHPQETSKVVTAGLDSKIHYWD